MKLTDKQNIVAKQLWTRENIAWRDPMQIASHWLGAGHVESELLEVHTVGKWWQVVEASRSTLLITREYENLVLSINAGNGKPLISYLTIPHPSGIAIDTHRQIVFIASTRNPNVIFDFSPISGRLERLDLGDKLDDDTFQKVLLPRRTRFYPGCFYIHDLALIDGILHANSVGQNAVARLDDDGTSRLVWWPNCIEKQGQPVFGQNHIQLNSIAAGNNILTSYFSASSDKISRRRPGHKNFPVDRRGVLFSGETRQPTVFGLTRPHSARLYNQRLFVDNSGYGEIVIVDGSKFIVITKLPGWTRGLAFFDDIAIVGTSRVIPNFRHYAPGIDIDKSLCGLHAVDLKTGNVLGSLIWPYGNQIFAVDLVPQEMTLGFPSRMNGKRSLKQERKLYYSFKFSTVQKERISHKVHSR